MRRTLAYLVVGTALSLAAGLVPGCDCNSTGTAHMDLAVGEDLAVPDAAMDLAVGDVAMPLDTGVPDSSCNGAGAGATCANDGDCCSGLCDPVAHVCVNKACGLVGATCSSAADCCGLACSGGQCGGQCVSQGLPCTSGGECCSTICGSNGTCTPLNTMCKTAGNACAADAECCNGHCLNLVAGDASIVGQCASPSQVSYCVQVGDICAHDADCCTGVCNFVAGAAVGTCAQITTSCTPDGETCDGCGVCCSHFCGPFGSSGSSICQPASGCHVQGDLCHKNSDCCGGDPMNGLGGAGQVVCTPDPTYPTKIGTCSAPNKTNCPAGTPGCTNTCDPAGDICHFTATAVCQGGTTNVRNDCCACISTKTCCQPDATGIPRCNLVGTCVAAGGICSFSGDCCNGLPCVPDSMGTLRCGTMTQGCGGTCTTNADCDTGLLCQVPPGALAGACTGPSCTPPPPDGGVAADMATTDLANADLATCAQYGQACSTTVPCCNGVTCREPSAIGSAACMPGDTNCTCYNLLP